ncbi:hypothetical protein [Salinigranum salinum]|uniref:hypothetical protein n=1 Tax=Salinigranum salinum TaxID=1364937 RepID=UPI0012610F93|nr:hypothetical protein [Salinigranum salinum]
MSSPPLSRRSLLASITGVGTAALAGCASLPPGPTGDVTLIRTRRLSIPDTSRPYRTPTDPHVLATRVHLDDIVTTAEPLLAAVPDGELDEDRSRDLRIGVGEGRDLLTETADDPASADAYGSYVGDIPYAAEALGFLQSWHGHTDFETARRRLGRMRASVAETAGVFDYRCVDPGRFLAGVGWAERWLYFADIADIGQQASPDVDGRAELADRVSHVRHHAEKMRRDVRSGRYVYRAYDDERPADAEPFAEALAANRRAVRERLRSVAVDREAGAERTESTDDPALETFWHRTARGAGEATVAQYNVERHLDRNRDVLAAVSAARAVCEYEGYHAASEADETVAADPSPEVLFDAKRRAVGAIDSALVDDDPFRAWLLELAADLVRVGDRSFENDLLDSDAERRASALAYYRRAAGAATAGDEVAATLERR